MRGRGRGRGNWRGASMAPQNEVPPPDSLKAEDNPAPSMEFYQQGMPEPDMDAMMPAAESDQSMQEGEMTEAPTRKRPWDKTGGMGGKNKRKKAKDLKIRRYVQPKNAVMCLNELKSGVVYTLEDGGLGQPFCISVEINNGTETQKYRGFGSSRQLAKQAAAEAALISFVRPPVSSGEGQEEDKTPWATLASFAIYKLFNDWREGRVGMCPPPAQSYGTALPPGLQGFLGQTPSAAGVKEDPAQATAFTEAICAHLGGRVSNTPAMEGKPLQVPEKVPKPAKQVPENAATLHPVMVLHQMKPGLQYITQTNKEENGVTPYFSVTAEIDGKTYSGEGPTVKKAKFQLAKLAIRELFGVESKFEIPSNPFPAAAPAEPAAATPQVMGQRIESM